MAIKKNLDVLIKEKLCDEIISGGWKPGQLLNVDELTEHFGVSRTPVLQALKSMNSMRMVNISSAGHYSVLAFNEKQVRDILTIRLLLEQQAVFELERNQMPIDIQALRKISRECLAANQSDRTEDVIHTRRTDMEFHRLLVAGARNECLSDLFERVQGQFMVANYLLTSHTHQQQGIAAEDHEHIIDALEKKDYAAARAVLQSHITEACEKILDRMSH